MLTLGIDWAVIPDEPCQGASEACQASVFGDVQARRRVVELSTFFPHVAFLAHCVFGPALRSFQPHSCIAGLTAVAILPRGCVEEHRRAWPAGFEQGDDMNEALQERPKRSFHSQPRDGAFRHHPLPRTLLRSPPAHSVESESVVVLVSLSSWMA